MPEPITHDRIQTALEKAGKLDSAYGPLGPSLGILELKPVYQEMRDFLTHGFSLWEQLQADIRAAEAYKTALDSHVAAQEQRAAALDSSLPPEERALQERLQAQHSQIAANDETLRRQEAGLFQNRMTLSEQADQINAITQQATDLRTQASRRSLMGV